MEIRKSNPELQKTIITLKKAGKEKPIWRKLAEELNKSTRKYARVNIDKIAKYTKEGNTVAVPGNVLGMGEITHPVTLAAFKVSETALKKIKDAKGKVISFEELIKQNPKGTGVIILR